MRALVLALALAAGCHRSAGELQLVDITRADLVVGVVVTGELEAVDASDVTPPSVGVWNFKIASLADEGVDVKAGDPVVTFDPSEQARDLETMRTEVDAARTQLQNKRDTAALARREEALAIANAEAVVRKAQLKADAPADLSASIAVETAKLELKSAELALQLAKDKAALQRRSDETDIAALRDRLGYATQRTALLADNIAKMKVTAPRAGTIVYPTGWRGQKKKVGDAAWRMEVVLQVVGLDKMIGKGAVDEVDIARVAANQPVTLRLDALPDLELHGTVQTIARAVRPRSDVDPSKVIDIKLALAPTTAPLRPGMRFRGEVETERVRDVVVIPADAVFVTSGGPVAYRDAGGSLEPVKLGLGRRNATMIEVTSGLAAGDRVSRRGPEEERR
jgi:multidrug efflux pump subunit AcrA (membrane-fusion protein)